MNEEISKLENEIYILEKRIKILESKENRRQAFFYIKLLVKIILIIALAYGVYRGYEYVVKEIPNIMEEKIKELNPFKKDS